MNCSWVQQSIWPRGGVVCNAVAVQNGFLALSCLSFPWNDSKTTIGTAAAAAGWFYRLSLNVTGWLKWLKLMSLRQHGMMLCPCNTCHLWDDILLTKPNATNRIFEVCQYVKKNAEGKKNRKSKNAQNPHVFIPGWSPPSRPATPQPLPIAQPGAVHAAEAESLGISIAHVI